MTHSNGNGHTHKVTFAMLLITLGIIYGDIGTSPLYVFKAIIGTSTINETLVYGGISCIFWTLTFQTTIKYVLLTLNADNKGEGGILALYALVRKRKKWLLFPAMIGASTLLADGLITPPISVSSAIEGLTIKLPNLPTVPIVCGIIFALFFFQRFGTKIIGAAFGPVMFVWFAMLAMLGLHQIVQDPHILYALNPMYAIRLLTSDARGYLILGAVFLCTTGAEALYSDLGHCGKQNIRLTWIYVKICLVLNYLGQGAWLMSKAGSLLAGSNPFYAIVPEWFLWTAIIISTAATIIASQALITGSFTLIAEAMRLNLWLRHKVNYTSEKVGQIYVPIINTILGIGCILVTLHFRESGKMEAAYGLSITLTMLMTSILICFYMWHHKFPKAMVVGYALVHGTLELIFLVANLNKFAEGGYVTILIAGGIGLVMYTMHRGRQIRNRYLEFVNIDKYIPAFRALSVDRNVPKHATHLVYLTKANSIHEVEKKVIHSIFENQPKRADVYWLIHVDSTDVPKQCDYIITTLAEDDLIRVDFRIGFRTEQQIGYMFKKVLEEVVARKEVKFNSEYGYVLHPKGQIEEEVILGDVDYDESDGDAPHTELVKIDPLIGDYKFVIIEKILSPENDLPLLDRLVTDLYAVLKKLSISDIRSYALERTAVSTESYPLIVTEPKPIKMNRVDCN